MYETRRYSKSKAPHPRTTIACKDSTICVCAHCLCTSRLEVWRVGDPSCIAVAVGIAAIAVVYIHHTSVTPHIAHGEAYGRLDASFPFGLFSSFSYIYTAVAFIRSRCGCHACCSICAHRGQCGCCRHCEGFGWRSRCFACFVASQPVVCNPARTMAR
jgi:hypothetical protein